MATAKQAPLSYPTLPAEGEEEQKKLQEIEQLRQNLKDTLDQRKGFFLDPTMLALVRGFSAPTKTGSFFESAGIAAGELGKTQEEEQKRAQDIARMKMELAMGEYGMMQQQKTGRMIEEALKPPGMPGAALPAGAAPVGGAAAPAGIPSGPVAGTAGGPLGAPAGVPSGAPTSAPTGAATISGTLTPEAIARIKLRDPEKGKILEEMVKDRMGRFKTENNVVYQMDAPGGPKVIMDLRPFEAKEYPTLVGMMSMTWPKYQEYQTILDTKGRDAAIDWLRNYRFGPKAEQEIKTTGVPTATEAAAQRVTAEERAKAENKRTQEAIEAGSTTAATAQYRVLEGIAVKPRAEKIFGVFSQPGIMENLLSLAAQGARGGNLTASIPGIENAYRRLGLSKEDIADFELAASVMANIQLQNSKMTQGQGAVSDYERSLFALAAISPQDRPETILRKIALYQAKSSLDTKIANALEDTGMSLSEFKKSSPEYKKYKAEYESQITRLVSNITGISEEKLREQYESGQLPTLPRPSQGAARPSSQGSPQRPDTRVINGETWERQRDGSWKKVKQ